jgi:hypothetical protein
MNYRTRERRFLLKASTTIGAGALLAACSSSPTTSVPPCGGGVCGSVGATLDGEAPDGQVPTEAGPPPLDGGADSSVAPCGGGVCGSIALPPDGGDASHP